MVVVVVVVKIPKPQVGEQNVKNPNASTGKAAQLGKEKLVSKQEKFEHPSGYHI